MFQPVNTKDVIKEKKAIFNSTCETFQQ